VNPYKINLAASVDVDNAATVLTVSGTDHKVWVTETTDEIWDIAEARRRKLIDEYHAKERMENDQTET
jgi:hypothetical protein